MKDSITIYSPGNIVSVTISNNMQIVDIEIQDSMFAIEQKPLLEEMISSTINQAYEQMSSRQQSNPNNSQTEQATNHIDNNPYSAENIERMKEMLQDGNFQDSMGVIMKDLKIDYKDGKPYCSIPMDMLGNEGIASIMEMFCGGSDDDDDEK